MRFAVALLARALTPAVRGEQVVENPRFCSSSGAFCVVVRQYPGIGDFGRMEVEEYWRTDPVEEWLAAYPKDDPEPPRPPGPLRAALYRLLPSGNGELLYEFTPESTRLFVTDDGTVVAVHDIQCDKKAKLVTIRSLSGSIVRTLDVRGVFTRHDQVWLCRGQRAVEWSLESALQAKVLVSETVWNDPGSRFETIEIDLLKEHPAPERDLCPTAVRVEAEPGAFLPQVLYRETPEYPVVAMKARVSGKVRAQLVIGNDGTVSSVTIIKPLPFGLDEAVRVAMLRWVFAPQPEPFTGEIEFEFELLRSPVFEVTTTTCFRSR